MRRLLPLLLGLCLLLCACGGQQQTRSAPAPGPSAAPLPEPSAAPLSPRPSVPVYWEGLLRLRGYDCEGTLYLCPEELGRLFGLAFVSEYDARGFALRLQDWTLEAPAEAEVYVADGRYLYCPEGYRVLQGRVYFPAELCERLFSVRISFDGARAELDASGFQLLRGGEDYYDTHYHVEDLYWLSHIIYAEAGSEPLAGQLGVGSVVLNRVRSELFPPTVMGVVLQRNHRIQFSPVENGRIAAEPDETAMLAACLCLEGYNPVGESLYFINPDLGDSAWFENALEEVVRIGNHVFYS